MVLRRCGRCRRCEECSKEVRAIIFAAIICCFVLEIGSFSMHFITIFDHKQIGDFEYYSFILSFISQISIFLSFVVCRKFTTWCRYLFHGSFLVIFGTCMFGDSDGFGHGVWYYCISYVSHTGLTFLMNQFFNCWAYRPDPHERNKPYVKIDDYQRKFFNLGRIMAYR